MQLMISDHSGVLRGSTHSFFDLHISTIRGLRETNIDQREEIVDLHSRYESVAFYSKHSYPGGTTNGKSRMPLVSIESLRSIKIKDSALI